MTTPPRSPISFLAGIVLGAGLGVIVTLVLTKREAPEAPPPARVAADVPGLPAEVPAAAPAPQPEFVAPDPAPVPDPEPEAEPIREEAPQDDPTLMPTAVLDHQCILDGILLDVDGEPLRSRYCAVEIRFGGHVIQQQTHTAPDGSFQTSFGGAIPPGIAGVLTMEPGPPPRRGIHPYVPPGVKVSVDLPHPLPAGNVDVGMLQLALLPLVVGGTVTTDSGALEGAKVELTVHTGSRHPSGYSLKTDAEGRFELRLEDEVRSGELSVSYEQWTPQCNIPFEPGQSDLHFHLESAGDVVAEVRCPVGHENGLKFELIDRRGTRHTGPVRWIRASGGTVSFAFRNLPLGSARLKVSDPKGRDHTDSVEVALGEQRYSIDLR